VAATSILSRRLELVPITPAWVAALVEGRRDEAAAMLAVPEIPAGWPDRHDEGFLVLRRGQMEAEPGREQWVRALVLREPERRLVGHAGFHGPPGVNGLERPRALELGYTVFPEHRGQGLATEAITALMDWAREEHGIDDFVASVAPANEPSLAIVRKLGFAHVGEQLDEEDGLELVFELTS
jgi:ribosomal-protein-alanine N-acetyltransferase